MSHTLEPLEAVRNFAGNKLSGPWSASSAAGHLKSLIEEDAISIQDKEPRPLRGPRAVLLVKMFASLDSLAKVRLLLAGLLVSWSADNSSSISAGTAGRRMGGDLPDDGKGRADGKALGAGMLMALMQELTRQASSSQDEWVRAVAASVGDCSGGLQMASLMDSFPLVKDTVSQLASMLPHVHVPRELMPAAELYMRPELQLHPPTTQTAAVAGPSASLSTAAAAPASPSSMPLFCLRAPLETLPGLCAFLPCVRPEDACMARGPEALAWAGVGGGGHDASGLHSSVRIEGLPPIRRPMPATATAATASTPSHATTPSAKPDSGHAPGLRNRSDMPGQGLVTLSRQHAASSLQQQGQQQQQGLPSPASVGALTPGAAQAVARKDSTCLLPSHTLPSTSSSPLPSPHSLQTHGSVVHGSRLLPLGSSGVLQGLGVRPRPQLLDVGTAGELQARQGVLSPPRSGSGRQPVILSPGAQQQHHASSPSSATGHGSPAHPHTASANAVGSAIADAGVAVLVNKGHAGSSSPSERPVKRIKTEGLDGAVGHREEAKAVQEGSGGQTLPGFLHSGQGPSHGQLKEEEEEEEDGRVHAGDGGDNAAAGAKGAAAGDAHGGGGGHLDDEQVEALFYDSSDDGQGEQDQ